MTAELYEQITLATSRANATLELIAHLALSSGKGLVFADAVRSVASQLDDAQEALDDYFAPLDYAAMTGETCLQS